MKDYTVIIIRIFCVLLLVTAVSPVLKAQLPYTPGDGKPSNIKFTTNISNGRFDTGDSVRIEARFDDWLGLDSEMKVRLNTGDTITMIFDPQHAEDLIDPQWGVQGKRNAILGGHDRLESYGVYCILELEGKGGYTQNKGKMVLGGGIHNYEEVDVTNPTNRDLQEGHDMLVVTDHNGKLLQGFGPYNDASNSQRFNREVRWVIETNDGGLLVCGAFQNYGDNTNYDYIVKFKYHPLVDEFQVDANFMYNLTNGGDNVTANGVIPQYVDDWGKPQRAVLQDTDGSIYITGNFTQFAGQTRYQIAKLNANGTLDATFQFPSHVFSDEGSTMSFDDDNPDVIWWGANDRVYRISKTTGLPLVDCDGDGDKDVNDWAPGPENGILAITVLPNSDKVDANGNPGPGGVLVTGRGTPNHSKISPQTGNTAGWGWHNGGAGLNALQDDLKPTPLSKFAPGGTMAYNSVVDDILGGWAIDGAAFLKGKMWLGTHDGDYVDVTNPPGNNYYEGGLIIMNYNGSLNTEFNHMLANATNTSSTGRPDGNYRRDGIGGDYSGGGTDIISLYVTSDDDLMVGGSYGSIMQYEENGGATSGYPDDQIITRLNFKRAVGYYYPSADDMVPLLKIEEIVPDHSITGAFGDPAGPISMDNISEEDTFEDNYYISINMPVAAPDNMFITKWEVQAGDQITLPMKGQGDAYYINWDYNPGISTGWKLYAGTTNNPNHTYSEEGTYKAAIICQNSADISSPKGKLAIDFETFLEEQSQPEETRIKDIERWGTIKWSSMKGAFNKCTTLDCTASDKPDLQNVTNVMSMFANCKKLVGTSVFNNWEVNNIADFVGMFQGAELFNQPLNMWNMGNANNLSGMFSGAKSFNQNINDWNVENISLTYEMFKDAISFNQPLDKWGSKLGNVTQTNGMFEGAEVFNQPLNNWVMPNLAYINRMFSGAVAFDQDISSWNISSLLNAQDMFKNAGLSTTNYDLLLMGWNAKVQAAGNTGLGTRAIKFHGGSSNYCIGADARKALIAKGWGDGDATGTDGGDATDHTEPTTGIVDGGADCSDAFITEWQVPESDKTIELGFNSGSVGCDLIIDWGDGNIQHFAGTVSSLAHTYTNAGNYNIKIMPVKLDLHQFDRDGDKLKSIKQWGTFPWINIGSAFMMADELTQVSTTDVPNLSGVLGAGLYRMFGYCGKLQTINRLSDWDVSSIYSTASMFLACEEFDAASINWGNKTANITHMQYMFRQAKKFNGDISSWNVRKVENMEGMFSSAHKFNQDISGWEPEKVTNMKWMFKDAQQFDQNIGGWDITELTTAEDMFKDAGLSTTNYDLLLMGWNAKVQAAGNTGLGTRAIKFHGGSSNYCIGADARKALIAKGWGDGDATGTGGGDATDHTEPTTGIVDGGSNAPSSIIVSNSRIEVCPGTGVIDLNHCISYSVLPGKSIVWKNSDGIPLAGSTINTTTLPLANMHLYIYEVEETHCGTDVAGQGQLFIKALNSISIENKTITVCYEDAGQLNLFTYLGYIGKGTWSYTPQTGDVSAPLPDGSFSGHLFNGHIAYGSSTAPADAPISFTFKYTPIEGECITGDAKVTVVIVSEF